MELTTMDERFDAEQKCCPDPEAVLSVTDDACINVACAPLSAFSCSTWRTHPISPRFLANWRPPTSPAAYINPIVPIQSFSYITIQAKSSSLKSPARGSIQRVPTPSLIPYRLFTSSRNAMERIEWSST